MIEHKDLPIQGIDWLKDRIKNSETLDNIVRYIKSSEVIITNTYHCAYWSILLNKKTIVIGKGVLNLIILNVNQSLFLLDKVNPYPKKDRRKFKEGKHI